VNRATRGYGSSVAVIASVRNIAGTFAITATFDPWAGPSGRLRPWLSAFLCTSAFSA